MGKERPLLQRGNGKTGEGSFTWSLPPVSTCQIGASTECLKHCYARQARYHFQSVQARLQWNYEQSLQEDWAERMIAEIRFRGVLALRWMAAGDIYSHEYATKLIRVMAKTRKVRHWLYTRSWVDPVIYSDLEVMAGFRHIQVWLSVDRSMPWPERVPVGAKIAYLQTQKDDRPANADFVFRIRSLRQQPRKIGLSVIPTCPEEQNRSFNCCACGNGLP